MRRMILLRTSVGKKQGGGGQKVSEENREAMNNARLRGVTKLRLRIVDRERLTTVYGVHYFRGTQRAKTRKNSYARDRARG